MTLEALMAKRTENTFNIDDALDNIDLTFNGYTPSEEALEFWALARVIMGKDFEVPNPLLHFWIVDLVFNNITRDQYPYSKEIRDTISINPEKLAIMMGRGTSKSTTITLFLVLYMAIKGYLPGTGKVGFVLGIGDSQDAGAKVMANTIRDVCEESVFIQNYFEKTRFIDTECEFVRKGDGPESTRSFLFKVKGAQGGVRGIRHRGNRVDVILADDIVKNEQDAHSETIMKAIKNTVYSDALNAMKASGGKIILIGTPMNKADVVYSAIESGAWTPVVIPLCKEINEDLKKEDFQGAWPQMHTYERLMQRYKDAVASNTTRSFNQELMLRISSEEDRMISSEMIQKFKRRDIMPNLAGFNLYITTDFTTTAEAKSDFSALAVWAVNSNHDFFLLDLCVRRQGIGEQYNELFRMVNEWSSYGRTVDVGIEIDGQQKAHVFALEEMMRKRNEFFTFARQKGKPPTQKGILSKSAGGNKHERFRLIYPKLQNMKFYFAEEIMDTPDWREAERQMKYTGFSGFTASDDFMDCISMLNSIDIIYPMVQAGSYTPVSEKRSANSIWDRGPQQADKSAYDNYL